MTIVVREDHGSTMAKIYLIEFDATGRAKGYYRPGESGFLQYVQFTDNANPENPIPLFEIPFYQVGNITKAFLLFADQSGIKTPTETHTAGKLEATERHLEDTRKWIDLLLSALKDQ